MQIYYLSSGSQRCHVISPTYNQGGWQAVSLSGCSRGKSVSAYAYHWQNSGPWGCRSEVPVFLLAVNWSLSLASRGRHGLGLMSPSSIFRASNRQSGSFHVASVSVQSWERFSAFEDSCDCIGSSWIFPDDLAISRFATLITSAKSFLSWKGTYLQVLRIKAWTSLETVSLPVTPNNDNKDCNVINTC